MGNKYKLRRGVTKFVSEYTKQTYEDASENNCEMIDWIISCIESEFICEKSDRKVILLKACRDLLKKQTESTCVLNLLEETAFYDEADCDGYCLIDDIEAELEDRKEESQ